MKYKNADYWVRQEQARRGVSALARLVGWNFEDQGAIVPPALREHGYDPAAGLVIIPWSGGIFAPAMSALREIRCTAVLVQPGVTTAGTSTFYFSVISWAKGELLRHDELRLWSLDERSFWLLPDLDGGFPDGPGYKLSSRPLRPTTSWPWKDAHEHGFGFGRADTLLQSMDAF